MDNEQVIGDVAEQGFELEAIEQEWPRWRPLWT
jgi:hypothetical protein